MPGGPMSLMWGSSFKFPGFVWSSRKGKLLVPLQKTGFGGSEAVPHSHAHRLLSAVGILRRAGTGRATPKSSLSSIGSLCSVSSDPAPSRLAGCAGGFPRPCRWLSETLNIKFSLRHSCLSPYPKWGELAPESANVVARSWAPSYPAPSCPAVS